MFGLGIVVEVWRIMIGLLVFTWRHLGVLKRAKAEVCRQHHIAYACLRQWKKPFVGVIVFEWCRMAACSKRKLWRLSTLNALI